MQHLLHPIIIIKLILSKTWHFVLLLENKTDAYQQALEKLRQVDPSRAEKLRSLK